MNSIKVGSPFLYKYNELETPLTPDQFAFASPKPKEQITVSDRFIPNRVSSNLYGLFNAVEDKPSTSSRYKTSNSAEFNKDDQNSQVYSNLLQSQILDQLPSFENLSNSKADIQTHCPQKKLFKFKSERKNRENTTIFSLYSSIQSLNNDTISPLKISRKIPKIPFKVLDAPNLQDDFYLNLLDWSSTNIISVGLENAVYVWSACNSKVTKLCEVPDSESITAVNWSQRGNHLAVGTSQGEVQIYDAVKSKLIKTFKGHEGRVGSISWNGYNICSGSRDKSILVRDVRAGDDYICRFTGHKQEISGLKWSFDENLLASGGNDNKLFVWSLKHQGEMAKFSQHQAAVKAIGWSPHQHNILASGGGTADRCIRFWNMQTLQMIDCVDTGSQVCNLTFSKNVNELVSTHGYSLNQINVWKYPTMQKIATLTGHSYRVLYLAMSPCGENIVTGAGDETIRFWSLFPGKTKNYGTYGKSSLFPSSLDLR